MRHRTRIWIAGSTAAALLATAAPALSATAAPAAGGRGLDGVWRTDGYSTIVRIAGGAMTAYDTSAAGCLPDALTGTGSALTGTGSGRTGPGGSLSFTDDDGTVSTFTPGPGAERARWRIDANVNSRALIRLPSLPAACSAPMPNTSVAVFDVFWRTFAENYPFFARHGVDWRKTYAEYRPRVTATTTPAQLTAILAAMIAPLHDAHVGLVVGRTVVNDIRPGTSAPSPEFDARTLSLIRRADLGPSVTLHTWCQGKVSYADLPGGIGYLRVSDFTGFTETDTFAANKAAFNAALDAVLTPARTEGPNRLRGLIVDVRVNGGGDDPLGIDLASRLTGRTFPAYAKRVRNDPADPSGFTAPQPILVRPAAGPRYTGPVAVLTAGSTFSAGEAFTQAMLNRTPRPVLVGENTQGVFSDILDRQLPNGWWFGLPDEEYLTPAGTTYDITGIPPDVPVPTLTARQFADGTDPAFQAALSELRY